MIDLEKKIDKMMEDITQIRIDQSEIKGEITVMKADIAHHIKRSDAQEENVVMLRQEFKPIKLRYIYENIIFKIVSGLIASLAFLHEMGWLQSIFKFLQNL